MGLKDLSYYFFNLEVMYKAFPALLSGLWVTIKVSGVLVTFGFMVGLFLAVIRTLDMGFLSKPINIVIQLYADLLRASPYLVLVTLVYYGSPYLGINLNPFWATVITFGTCLSAFAEEIFRASIEAISKGQVEAARSLGLTHLQTMRYIILPWGLLVAIPPLTNRTTAIVKAVSMASAIMLPELLKEARHLQAIFANPTPLIQAAILYVLFFYPLIRLSARLEKRRTS